MQTLNLSGCEKLQIFNPKYEHLLKATKRVCSKLLQFQQLKVTHILWSKIILEKKNRSKKLFAQIQVKISLHRHVMVKANLTFQNNFFDTSN